MKSFESIEKLDLSILYLLELTSSLSVLLLAFGLIASMANVLTKGAVLTDNLFMQRVWAWTQCIAIDASVAGTIIRTFRYHQEGEKVKAWLYGLLSTLLLFTAAIVLNIESVQQTLNFTLDAAYIHVFVPVEALIWVRSVAIVLLIVAHAMRHVGRQKDSTPTPATTSVISDEHVHIILAKLAKLDALEQALTGQTSITETQPQQIEAPANVQQICEPIYGSQFTSFEQPIYDYLENHQEASTDEVARAVGCHSLKTAEKWIARWKEKHQ